MSGNIPTRAQASLYIHIPFCTRKCDYCHFYVLPDKPELKNNFMLGLQLEWERVAGLFADKEIVSVYFGGGTPYLLGPKWIEKIIAWSSPYHANGAIEITLEANPENVDAASLAAYRASGINRLSIGVQSLDDHQLITLSRRHTAEKAIAAVEMANKVGFNNISIDLMYDLPGQTLKSWERTVKRASSLPITHLSLYNLTIEPHTVFFKKREKLQAELPDEIISKEMYDTACHHFHASELQQYEISAFARDELISTHNSGYWEGRPFLGLGPSAFSYWEGKRFSNIANLSKYTSKLQAGTSAIDFSEKLSLEASQRELLVIGLRLLAGVDINAFETKHGHISSDCKRCLANLEKEGFLYSEGSRYRMTKKGILFYDSMAEELIL